LFGLIASKHSIYWNFGVLQWCFRFQDVSEFISYIAPKDLEAFEQNVSYLAFKRGGRRGARSGKVKPPTK
jgi:hypothetical protein